MNEEQTILSDYAGSICDELLLELTKVKLNNSDNEDDND